MSAGWRLALIAGGLLVFLVFQDPIRASVATWVNEGGAAVMVVVLLFVIAHRLERIKEHRARTTSTAVEA